jgi:1-acyl-sn-glycerol-3-phosphate acyltransferase
MFLEERFTIGYRNGTYPSSNGLMNYFRATYNWGQTATKAVFYGTIGCVFGWLPGARPLAQWCMYRWCKGSADGLRIRRKLVNEEYLNSAPQAVIVANHLSSLDILVLGGFLRMDYRWLAKSTLFKVPFSGWYLKIAGHIPVRRDLESEARAALIKERIGQVVDEGASVLFFPEGTRSADGRLKDFRIGAFIAAIQHDLPILPLVLRGTHELMVKGAKDLAIRADRECTLTALDLIPASLAGTGSDHERAEQLRSLCFDAIAEELRSERERQIAS